MIEPKHPELSIRRQCELVGLNRSTYYWQPAGETALKLALMEQIDKDDSHTVLWLSKNDSEPCQKVRL